MVCRGIPNTDDVTNFLHSQVLCSALNFSQQISFSFRFVEEEVEDFFVVLYKYNDISYMFFFSGKI